MTDDPSFGLKGNEKLRELGMIPEYEKVIKFIPAWDRRDPDPKKDYGVHGLDIMFILKGKEGATTVDFSTGWLLPATVGITDPERMYQYADRLNKNLSYPRGRMLAYHSPIQRYEDQPRNECEFTKEGFCYTDGTYLGADKVLKRFLEEGEDGVWDELSEFYVYHLIENVPVREA